MIGIRLREAIKAYRQRTGEYLTYKKLAQRTGLSINTLDSIMSPTRPYNATLRTINTLCHALRCTPAELLTFQWDTEDPLQTESSIGESLMSTRNMSGYDSPDAPLPSEWILQTEAARLRGVRRQSISELVQAGRLTTRVIDGRTFVRRADVLAFQPRRPGRRKASDEPEP